MKAFVRAVLLPVFVLAFVVSVKGQTVFWSDNFENGCGSGCLASTWNGWSIVSTGSNGSAANNWVISCADNGNAAGACGSGCGSDESLHIGAVGSTGDLGASFNETGGTNQTNRLARSPIIDCSGRTNISLNFVYIGYGGSCTFDHADVRYSSDGGASWSVLTACLQAPCCGSNPCDGYSQGLWTAYTMALPASANNNPNVRIGFNWTNNGDGSGTDPSVAIDDVTLTVPSVLPVELAYFEATPSQKEILLKWGVPAGLNYESFEIQKSVDAINFRALGNLASGKENYSFADDQPDAGVQYYRLRISKADGLNDFSETVAVMYNPAMELKIMNVRYDAQQQQMLAAVYAPEAMEVMATLNDQAGREMIAPSSFSLKGGVNDLTVDFPALPAGVYYLKLTPAGSKPLVKKVVIH